MNNLKNIKKFYDYFIQNDNIYKPTNECKKVDIIIFVLYLNYFYWDKKNYRCDTYQKDMIDNLKNVIIPRTPIYFSYLVQSKIIYLISVFIYLLFFNVNNVDNWFLYWRINCILSTHHHLVTNPEFQENIVTPKFTKYEYENKYKFLEFAKGTNKGTNKGKCKVSPFIKEYKCIYIVDKKKYHNIDKILNLDYDIVIKDPNIEGGMGIYFYDTKDYHILTEKPNINESDMSIFNNINYNNQDNNKKCFIIQKRMLNASYLNSFLPINAPLSTLRIVSSKDTIWTSVFRAGYENAKTDHESILHKVDKQGNILSGCINQNWYNFNGKNNKNITVPTNVKILNYKNIISTIKKYHNKYLSEIPIIGWDVALTDDDWNILEINLSCNLFCGNFNKDKYYKYVDKIFKDLNSSKNKNVVNLNERN